MNNILIYIIMINEMLLLKSENQESIKSEFDADEFINKIVISDIKSIFKFPAKSISSLNTEELIKVIKALNIKLKNKDFEFIVNKTKNARIIPTLIISLLKDRENWIFNYLVAMYPYTEWKIDSAHLDYNIINIRTTTNKTYSITITLQHIINILKQVDWVWKITEIASSIYETSNAVHDTLELWKEISNQSVIGEVAIENLSNTIQSLEKTILIAKQQQALALSDLGSLKEKWWTIEVLKDQLSLPLLRVTSPSEKVINCKRFICSKDWTHAGVTNYDYPDLTQILDIRNLKTIIKINNHDWEINLDLLEIATRIANNWYEWVLENEIWTQFFILRSSANRVTRFTKDKLIKS